MSTSKSVQGVIAQTMLNNKVYRDLDLRMKSMMPPLGRDEEVEAFLRETGLTPEELVENIHQSMVEATQLALPKLKEKMQKNLKAFNGRQNKNQSQKSGPGGETTTKG